MVASRIRFVTTAIATTLGLAALKSGRAEAQATVPSGVGDVVMSLLDLTAFRKSRNDTGPNGDFSWYPCDGVQSLPGTPLGANVPAALTNVPDFRGRYPRGGMYGPSEHDPLLSASEGGIGTAIADTFAKHDHGYSVPKQSVSKGDGETALVHNPRPESFSSRTSSEGSTETRPKSIIVRYYIRVR